ncbi:MAG: hypothetical protein IRZ04_06775 [Rhodospirillales bacterium]|nr:hypothetical protein [Rhodospirillales bacterium]
MLDRLVGLILFLVFAPALAMLALLLAVVSEGPIFEQRLRIEAGALYRTRRFRVEGCRLGAFLERYSLDELPVVLDLATGQARLCIGASRDPQGLFQISIAIRAPKPKMTSHPSAANPSHINRIME